MAWISGATLFLIIVSVIFIRNQVRPIEQLADAMERFGRGEDSGSFRVRGAREVRGASNAFFDMRERIKRHIEQRSQLLAGVSHDLRTPLTRLKLQLALMPPSPEIDDAKRDLAEMEETLDEYLAFAKGLSEEAPEQVDLGLLAQDIVADTVRNVGGDIAVDVSGQPATSGRARALKRCLANLIDNAAAHGDTRARHASRAKPTPSPSPSTTTARASPRNSTKKPSAPSRASTPRARATRRAWAWASPSPATSPAAMAATSSSARAPWAACAPPCACRARGNDARPAQGGVDETRRL